MSKVTIKLGRSRLEISKRDAEVRAFLWGADGRMKVFATAESDRCRLDNDGIESGVWIDRAWFACPANHLPSIQALIDQSKKSVVAA